MKIEDNFLEQNIFDELQALIVEGDFAWYYNPYIVSDIEPEKEFQFTHTFYIHNTPQSSYFKDLGPLLEKIFPISFWRIKANLLTRTSSIEKYAFHIDIGDLDMFEEKLKQWTTSIFYMNTNNGYTEFEDGTQVESVANRMVTFPANLKHRGTSCTDEKTRVVINFNYFK